MTIVDKETVKKPRTERWHFTDEEEQKNLGKFTPKNKVGKPEKGTPADSMVPVLESSHLSSIGILLPKKN